MRTYGQVGQVSWHALVSGVLTGIACAEDHSKLPALVGGLLVQKER